MIEFVDLGAQQRRIKDKIDAGIQRVLAHGRYIQGPEVAELEARLAEYTGSNHCITVANGTDAFGGLDALAAASFCGQLNAPLLLTDNPLSTEAQTFLTTRRATLATATILGGTTAITGTTESAIEAAIG